METKTSKIQWIFVDEIKYENNFQSIIKEVMKAWSRHSGERASIELHLKLREGVWCTVEREAHLSKIKVERPFRSSIKKCPLIAAW